MDTSSLLALTHNATLLLAMVFIYDLTSRYRVGAQGFWPGVPIGVALGVITIVIMLTPWIYKPGIIFDTRTVLLGISGLFFGLIPTLIAMLMGTLFRLYQGGVAEVTGVLTIISAGSLGIFWRYCRRGELAQISRTELYFFGVVVHLAMAGMMFALPRDLALEVLSVVMLPVMVIYPLATMLMGQLLVSRLVRDNLADNLAVSEEIIWQQTNFDRLTRLPNRSMMVDYLAVETEKATNSGQSIGLLLLDLDLFKGINDTLGHEVGDQLLQQTAERLRANVQEMDTVVRLGGDEFAIILPDVSDTRRVEQAAENILRCFSEPFLLGAETTYISASIGIALYPDDAANIEELLKHADQAMYAAKDHGRNRYHYFTPQMQELAQQRMRLINDLRTALSEQQLMVYYQPIVDLQTGVIQKAEALVRWQHPQRGLVSPCEFIPLAEETGLIHELGNWVFMEAANQVAQWRDVYGVEIHVSINKSPVQFLDEADVSTTWIKYLEQLKLGRGAITLEITEGLLLDARQVVRDKLLTFHKAGVQIALDDFGTGYSSLSYLQKFEIDFLKIDQSFIRNLGAGSDESVLCEAIIVMSHKLNIKVIAEGVETEQQRSLLAAAGCDYAQGYLFSRPIPATDFEQRFLAER